MHDPAKLTELFKEECESHGMTILTLAADKHGSLVWEAAWRNTLNRYLTLALTYLADGLAEPEELVLSFWVAADDGFHFAERTTFEGTYPVNQFGAPFWKT